MLVNDTRFQQVDRLAEAEAEVKIVRAHLAERDAEIVRLCAEVASLRSGVCECPWCLAARQKKGGEG